LSFCACVIYTNIAEIISLIKKNIGFLPALAWLFVVTFLLTIPGSAIPKENWLDKIWADKWVHIGLFSIMVILWCRAMHMRGYSTQQLRKQFIWIVILTATYGTGMEFVQKYLVSNRSFDIGDIVADTVGAIIGWMISLRWYIKK